MPGEIFFEKLMASKWENFALSESIIINAYHSSCFRRRIMIYWCLLSGYILISLVQRALQDPAHCASNGVPEDGLKKVTCIRISSGIATNLPNNIPYDVEVLQLDGLLQLTLDVNSFSQFIDLKRIRIFKTNFMDKNWITSKSQEWFDDIHQNLFAYTNVAQLELIDCNLKDENVFRFPSVLRLLNVSRNKYTRIDLRGYEDLEVVNMESNELTTIPQFSDPSPSVHYLNVEFNPEITINVNDLAPLCSLKKLLIDEENSINTISRKCECERMANWSIETNLTVIGFDNLCIPGGHSVSEKYAELKFTEHSNPSSPYKVTGLTCNGNKAISPAIKVLEKNDISVLPVLSKCQLHTKNGLVNQANNVNAKYNSFVENEVTPENSISYYGNITGWHRYESPSKHVNPYAYPAPEPPISKWSDAHVTSPPEPEPPRSPIKYVKYSPDTSPLAATKARFDWSKNGVQRARVTDKIISDAFRKNSISKESPTTSPEPKETSLLKAIKLEDTSVLCDLLNEPIIEDINATDETGRTVMSYAVSKNCLPIIEKLTKIPGMDVNKPDNEGNCPLHFCAQAGQVEAMNLLLNSCSGIELDARNQYGVTPLMKAALQGRTKCAKLLLFAGASPTMRDYGRGLRAEQWARYCGRYICADVIEKYARNQLLSKTASYGNWGGEPELGLHLVNGKLQPPAIVLQNAINQSYKNNGIKSKLKKAFQRTAHPSNWNSNSRVNSFSLVTQLTSAALCVSSPVLPNSSKVSPVVKSLIRPFVIPRIEITPDSDISQEETSSIDSDSKDLSDKPKTRRRSSYFIKLRKKSFI